MSRVRMSLIVGVDLTLMKAHNIVPPGAGVENRRAKTQDAQARALEELGSILFSPTLVEQVESDFHSASGQGGNAPAQTPVAAGPEGQTTE